MITSYNFSIIHNSNDLPFLNRGFQYGDGIFETLLSINDDIQFVKDHYNRIERGLGVLSLDLNFDLEKLEVHLKELSQKVAAPIVKVKIYIWRKTGKIYSGEPDIEVLITVEPGRVRDEPIKEVGFSQSIQNRYTVYSDFKRLSSMPYTIASNECIKRNLDDMIILDLKGHVSELLTSSIFWIKDRTLYTPSTDTGCIDGVMKRQVIQVLKNTFEIREGLFSKKEILTADSVFSANIGGIAPLMQIEETSFDHAHPVVSSLKSQLH